MQTQAAKAGARDKAQAPASRALMVVHPALNRPLKPSALSAERMTAPQNGATSSDQSAILIPCGRMQVRQHELGHDARLRQDAGQTIAARRPRYSRLLTEK